MYIVITKYYYFKTEVIVLIPTLVFNRVTLFLLNFKFIKCIKKVDFQGIKNVLICIAFFMQGQNNLNDLSNCKEEALFVYKLK